jgi:hypothetical protein
MRPVEPAAKPTAEKKHMVARNRLIAEGYVVPILTGKSGGTSRKTLGANFVGFVPSHWRAFSVDLERITKLGGAIEIKEYPNDDHFSLPANCAPDARKWLNGLF